MYISRSVRSKLSNNTVLFSLKIFFTFTISVDADGIQQYAVFHQGIYCLQNYSLRGFPNTER